MGKPKRIVLWEGDTSNLPSYNQAGNSNLQKKIDYNSIKPFNLKNIYIIGSDLAVGETKYLTLRDFNIKEDNSGRSKTPLLILDSFVKIDIPSDAFIYTLVSTIVDANNDFGIQGWGANGGEYCYCPGIYLVIFYNSEKHLKITAANQSDITDSIQSSGIRVEPLTPKTIFEEYTTSRMAFNEDNSIAITNQGRTLFSPVILDEEGYRYAFSANAIKSFLETGKPAVILSSTINKYDTAFKDLSKYTHKTYDQLGLQELYNSYNENKNN